jgi:GT2 family glycosyltransferase
MSDRSRAPSAFIIATYNRPDDLRNTVKSLLAQTVLPAELCIVDSSPQAPAKSEIVALCAETDLPLDYHHPAARGLTVQRNAGIDRTTGDPVFFIDDDVEMAPDCHEQILAEYARWGPELGGVRATPVRPARPAWYTIMYRKLFGIGGWWPESSGKVRAGFYAEGISEAAGVRKVEYFNGWFMSYRREVFGHERFDEALAGYGYKEDIDFSYRVSRFYPLEILERTP